MKGNTKQHLMWTVFFTLVYVFCNVNYPLLIQQIMDDLSVGEFSRLPIIFVLLLLVLVILNFACQQRVLAKARYMNQVKSFYREGVMQGIFAQHRENLSSEEEAKLLSVFNNDIPMICSDYHETMLTALYSLMAIIFAFSAIVSIHPLMALLILLQMLLLAVIPKLFRKRLQEQKKSIADTLKTYNIRLKDSLFCLPVFKSYMAEREALSRSVCAGEKANAASYAHSKTASLADLASMSIGYGGDFCLYLLGAFLIFRGNLSIGGLLAVIQITNVLANPITTIAYNFNTMQAVKPIRNSVMELIKTKSPHEETDEEPWRELELRSVCVEKNGQELLHSVDLKLEQGKKYLLVGANGCGKSTLLKVLNRNLKEHSGEVLVNGRHCSDFREDQVMVYQESYLFTGSVRENICLYNAVEEETLKQLAELTEIDALLDMEDETAVHRFSGGEKQKVALCRALIRNPRLLLLDEAFSAMDSSSRSRLEEWLLKQEFAMVHIAHSFRKELVERYDAVIFMEEGRIEEVAPYAQLSEKVKTYIPFE